MLKTIAGFEIDLEEGKRYLASRPFADGKRKVYPVTVTQNGEVVLTIQDLSYVQAHLLVNEFNNEEMSFTGRVW